MTHNLDDTIALLTRGPGTFDALLRGLPDAWTGHDEGPGTWTVVDVLGHLIHAEHTDWMARARIVLESGETRAFPSFDRQAHRRESVGKSLDELLDEFAAVRADNLRQLRALALSPDDLVRRGRHPVFGAVTLSELLATWAAHDLTHLHQVSRIMAHQYRAAVGPWQAYLGVLQCTGHSA